MVNFEAFRWVISSSINLLFLRSVGLVSWVVSTLLPISEFVLDEKFQRNASKFAIFYIYENPKLLFPFFISCYFIFLPNECPSLCRHSSGHSLCKNKCSMKWKTEKATLGFRKYKIWQILQRFAGTFRRAQTLKLGRVTPKLNSGFFFSCLFLHY